MKIEQKFEKRKGENKIADFIFHYLAMIFPRDYYQIPSRFKDKKDRVKNKLN